MRDKLLSRKLWLTLGAVVAALCAAGGGQETWSQAIWQIVATVMAYLGIQGAVDMKTATAGK